jgi:hypothetical protein
MLMRRASKLKNHSEYLNLWIQFKEIGRYNKFRLTYGSSAYTNIMLDMIHFLSLFGINDISERGPFHHM